MQFRTLGLLLLGAMALLSPPGPHKPPPLHRQLYEQ